MKIETADFSLTIPSLTPNNIHELTLISVAFSSIIIIHAKNYFINWI